MVPIQAHLSAVRVLMWALWLAVPLGIVAVSVVVSLQSHTDTYIRLKRINQEAVLVLEWSKAFLPTGLLTWCDNSGFEKGDFLTNTLFLSPWWWLVMRGRALLTWSLHGVERVTSALFRVETYWITLGNQFLFPHCWFCLLFLLAP